MNYTEEELRTIYNNAQKNQNTFVELNDISEQLNLILKYMVYDDDAVNNMIEMLFYFKKHNLLYKVNEVSISLITKICMGKRLVKVDNANLGYYEMIIKNLLLPSSLNYCDHEYNLPLFLANFDLLWSFILENCTPKNMEIIGEYNESIYKIMKVYARCNYEYVNSKLFFKTKDLHHIIMDNVLTHIATILYLKIDEYAYNYDLLYESYMNICKNYYGFLRQCVNNNIDIHAITLGEDVNCILDDYSFSEKILHQTFQPPVEIKIYRK